ncbi:uncharacterized protein LOC128959308 [Oppia nitens]|uniref:uncharacterized protein LOC128959308 n=1 Tax=Oppia nitens TaxID=1686743 RepID=UPI0023DB9E8A|nr:uncharacterized protein LOC128959308 [Oppia nitens]
MFKQLLLISLVSMVVNNFIGIKASSASPSALSFVENDLVQVDVKMLYGPWSIRASTVLPTDPKFSHNIYTQSSDGLLITKFNDTTSLGTATLKPAPGGSRIWVADINYKGEPKQLRHQYPVYLDYDYRIVLVVRESDPKNPILEVYARPSVSYNREPIDEILNKIQSNNSNIKKLIGDYVPKLHYVKSP